MAEQLDKSVAPLRFRLVPLGVGVILAMALLDPAARATSPQAPPREIYQDFRKGRPLLSSFAMDGPDLDDVVRPDPAGLRITLPADRPQNFAVAVVSKFSLVGDFEVTGSYELLSATQPKEGYGVGVCLWVATDPGRRKFAKVARMLLPKQGSVYKTEFWDNGPPKVYKAPSIPTTVKQGRLRLVREKELLRCQVADDADVSFREVLQVHLGAEDLSSLRFEVTDSWKPGNAVDARLIDLKVRSGTLPAAPDVDAEPVIPAAEEKPVPKKWLMIVQIGGLLVALSFLGLGGWLALRRRVSGPPSALASPGMIALTCPGCGKSMKVQAGLAGKKGRCRHCGGAILVPAGEAEPT